MRLRLAAIVCACVVLEPSILASDAFASWPADGEPVCLNSGTQGIPWVGVDYAGVPTVFWNDARNGHSQIFGRKFAPDGTADAAWPTDGRALTALPLAGPADVLADGAGGYYLASVTIGQGFDTYLQHIASTGDPAPGWSLAGIPIATGPGSQDLPSMAPDDSGGVFVVWEDSSAPYSIRGVRLHSDGTVAVGWIAGGKQLSTPGSVATTAHIVTDGAGGFVATWVEQRPPATGDFASGFAFRYRPDGSLNPGWPVLGVPLMQRTTILQQPFIASDGAGGLFSVWADFRNAPANAQPYNDVQYWDVYGQHVLANGSIAPGWPADAMPISTAANTQWYPALIADGQGGMICEWQDFRNNNEDVFAVRLHADGTRAAGWATNGSPVIASVAADLSKHLVSDGAGGMYAGVDDASNLRSYVQHLMADGGPDPRFGAMGVPVSDQPASQKNVAVTGDGKGGVYAAWEDSRGGTDPSNIWANHFGLDIATAITVSLMSSDIGTDYVSLTWEAPQSLRASVERREGNAVWQTLGEVTTDGEDRLRYDDRAVVPGGSYTYRLRYADGGSTAYTAENTLLVPASHSLALAGFRPNPATAADLTVAFELPSTEPATLELVDITGRRVASQDLSGYAAGRYSERLATRGAVPAGVYWVRLTHGGRSVTARGVVVR